MTHISKISLSISLEALPCSNYLHSCASVSTEVLIIILFSLPHALGLIHCISFVFFVIVVAMIKYPGKSNLREGRFIELMVYSRPSGETMIMSLRKLETLYQQAGTEE